MTPYGFRRQTIEIHIATRDGGYCVEVAALVRGALAVHRAWEGDGYTITHLPTKHAVIRGIPRRKAISAVRVFERMLDWRRVMRKGDGVVGAPRKALRRAAEYKEALRAS
jgi:hypothetical protein